MRREIRTEVTTYVWVRWLADGGYSSWHQVREDCIPHPFEGDVVRPLLRLWTRCGFEVPDPQALELSPGSSTPVGQACIYCTRSHLVQTMPPLGTPPVPGGRRRVFLIDPPRRRGALPAPSVSADHAHTR